MSDLDLRRRYDELVTQLRTVLDDLRGPGDPVLHVDRVRHWEALEQLVAVELPARAENDLEEAVRSAELALGYARTLDQPPRLNYHREAPKEVDLARTEQARGGGGVFGFLADLGDIFRLFG